MLLAPCGDVGIDPTIAAGLGVGLAPVARIRNELLRQGAGAGLDALQHWDQVFDNSCGEGCAYRSLVAHPDRHDHLMLAVHCGLGFVALDVPIAALHHVAVVISKFALGLWSRFALVVARQAPGGHGHGFSFPPDPPFQDRFPSPGPSAVPALVRYRRVAASGAPGC
jgi:hypothetical protein